jgi:hypothetical protein
VSNAAVWTVRCQCGQSAFVTRSYFTHWRKTYTCSCGERPTWEPTHLVAHPHARPERHKDRDTQSITHNPDRVISVRVPVKVWDAIVAKAGGEQSPSKLFKRMVSAYLSR